MVLDSADSWMQKKSPAEDATTIDEPAMEASQPPGQPSRSAKETKAPEQDSQCLADAFEPPVQPSPTRSVSL